MTTDYQNMTDEQARAFTQGCFGLQFSPGDESCVKVCMLRDRCIKSLGAYIPRLKESAGRPDMAIGEIAAACGTDELGVKLALEVVRGRSLAGLLPPQNQPPVPVPEAATTPAEEEALLDSLVKPPPVQTEEAVVRPPPLKEKTTVKKVAKKPEKKAAVAKVPEKAAREKKAIAVAPRPLRPSLMKDPLAALVSTKRKAPPPAVQKAQKPPAAQNSSLSAADMRAAFDQERARSAFAAELKHGTVLERKFKGRLLTVKVDEKRGCYVMDGTAHPTLYGLVMQLTGGGIETPGGKTTSKWSLKRFWARD